MCPTQDRSIVLVTQGPRGVFVTVEGLDFSGKSTLMGNLEGLLTGLDPSPYFTREPGGTATAERIRTVLLDPELDMDPWTEAYLYAAARSDLVRREILPRLKNGRVVLCERFLDSSIAYQGAGRGLGLAAVRELNLRAVVGV
ncbi:MAG: dTMP kinase, partial [Rubrobacter sp.]|nr:dTMP kinase [Rubrobacter sp.]